jgi:hypothetical protein
MKKLLTAFAVGVLISGTAFAHRDWHEFHGYIPSDAFRTGTDINGAPLYLCRGQLFGSTQPGKTWAGYNKCNVPYGGRSYYLQNAQIFVNKHLQGYWVKGHGYIPNGAMRVGTDTNGNPLFLCRAYYQGSVQPGKTWANYHACNIPFAGREIQRHSYSVFIVTDGARPWHHGGRPNWGPGPQWPSMPTPPPIPQSHCVIGPNGQASCGNQCVVEASGKVVCG